MNKLDAFICNSEFSNCNSNMRAILFFSLFLVTACQAPENTQKLQETATEKDLEYTLVEYPAGLLRVLERHGGIELWRKMQRLSFEIVKESGNEKHYIQLQDRRDKVEGPNFTMGFDGNEVWMESDTTYKGNPEFYHNLMFYFYAMPFVLADDGIIYGDIDPLEFEGTSYPGISVSYNEGVGSSSKDEYFIYYDPETYQMAWLGYTVTYFSKQVSEEIKWIHYKDWIDVGGFSLPSAITWYKYQENLPTEARNTVEFLNTRLSSDPFEKGFFNKP